MVKTLPLLVVSLKKKIIKRIVVRTKLHLSMATTLLTSPIFKAL